MTVDYTKPIWCVQNGARLEVLGGPDHDGDYRVKPVEGGTWPSGDPDAQWFSPDGERINFRPGIRTITNTPPVAKATAIATLIAAGYTLSDDGSLTPRKLVVDYEANRDAVNAYRKVFRTPETASPSAGHGYRLAVDALIAAQPHIVMPS